MKIEALLSEQSHKISEISSVFIRFDPEPTGASAHVR
jgi:hypothetical protein